MNKFQLFFLKFVYLNLFYFWKNQSAKNFKILSLYSLFSTFFYNAEQIVTNLFFSCGIYNRFSFNLIVSIIQKINKTKWRENKLLGLINSILKSVRYFS